MEHRLHGLSLFSLWYFPNTTVFHSLTPLSTLAHNCKPFILESLLFAMWRFYLCTTHILLWPLLFFYTQWVVCLVCRSSVSTVRATQRNPSWKTKKKQEEPQRQDKNTEYTVEQYSSVLRSKKTSSRISSQSSNPPTLITKNILCPGC